MTINPQACLEIAVAAARAAGGHAREQRHRRGEANQRLAHDVKLALDVECQSIAEEILRSRAPGYAILGEESTGDTKTADPDLPLWIIDPIDGTVNFSHGLPFWCCSIGIRLGACTLAGAVYAPDMNALYTATADGPALCNGAPLRVSSIAAVSEALIMTGLDKQMDPRRPSFEVFRAISVQAQKTRIAGSAALDLCLVASGQADAYFESGIYVWDIAAAALIVERAGGRTGLLGELGDGRLRFLASNGLIHDALREIIVKPSQNTQAEGFQTERKQH
ncbi:MAG: inositol monophosphatase family protein [bacterium]